MKDYKYFISIQPIKFNEIQIKLSLNEIVLIKKSYVDRIFLVIFHNKNFNGLNNINKIKLLLKKLYTYLQISRNYYYKLAILFALT